MVELLHNKGHKILSDSEFLQKEIPYNKISSNFEGGSLLKIVLYYVKYSLKGF